MNSPYIEKIANNQNIIHNGNNKYFQSYNVIVAAIKDNKVLIDPKYYNYSKTTMKYLCSFLGDTSIKDVRNKLENKEYIFENLN